MKKIIAALFFLSLASCWFSGSSSERSGDSTEEVSEDSGVGAAKEESTDVNIGSKNTPPSDVRVYVSIVTHSEEYKGLNSGEPDYVNDEDAFWEYRQNLLDFANMLHDEGVKYNYQSDWTFLMAVGKYDTGTASTNGKNIVRYIKEDLGFEVDPHAHETKYNIADVAYLIKALGVEPSHTAGGYIALPVEDSKLEYLWNEIKAEHYNYKWQAEVLWGGGTGLHQDEESLWYSGVWRPKDDAHSTVNDDDAPLVNVGKYKEGWDSLDYLLSQNLAAGKIYTETIMGHQRDLSPSFTAEFKTEIEKYKKDARIHWAGIAEVADIWAKEYNSEVNMLKYDGPIDEDSSSNFGGKLQNSGGGKLRSKVLNE